MNNRTEQILVGSVLRSLGLLLGLLLPPLSIYYLLGRLILATGGFGGLEQFLEHFCFTGYTKPINILSKNFVSPLIERMVKVFLLTVQRADR